MALIATQTAVLAGTAPTPGNAAAGDTTNVGTHLTLVVLNGSGASITVTVAYPGTLPSGDAYPSKQYTVAAAGARWIPLLPQYGDPTTGQASITYSSTTSVTRYVFAPYG